MRGSQGDRTAYEALIAGVQADGLWVRDLLHNTAAGLIAAAEEDEDAAAADAEAAANLPAMECQPFEHYDYLMLLFRHEQDFQRACEVLGIKKVEVTYPGGLRKIGLGRCIDGARAVERLTSPGASVSRAER